MLDTIYNGFAGIIANISTVMYSYLLIIMLLAVGLFFTFRGKFIQFRMLGESIRVVGEKSGDKGEKTNMRYQRSKRLWYLLPAV